MGTFAPERNLPESVDFGEHLGQLLNAFAGALDSDAYRPPIGEEFGLDVGLEPADASLDFYLSQDYSPCSCR